MQIKTTIIYDFTSARMARIKEWKTKAGENVPETQETNKIFQGSLISPDPQSQMMGLCIVLFGSGF